MKYVISAEEMKQCDATTMQHFGVPSCVLMERAALSVFELIRERKIKCESNLVVCGSGNNGGDGMVIARLLFLAGKEVELVMAGNPEHLSEEAKRQMGILKAYGIKISEKIGDKKEYDIIFDALFGIGLSRKIQGTYADVIEQMNQIRAYKVAVDIASGISVNTGQILGKAFRADLTVTFAFAKYGQLLDPGRSYSGELVVKEIGITKESFLDELPEGIYYEEDDLKQVPARIKASNKGSYGKVLSVTGSCNMAGASYFASKAASMAGAGLVYIHTCEENRVILQELIPEAVLNTYKEDTLFGLEAMLENCNIIVCGCGLGKSKEAKEKLTYLLENASVPLLLDADALNLISEDADLEEKAKTYQNDLIITPHMGEAARLLKASIDEIKKDRIKAAKTLSEKLNCVTVLKDAATVCKGKSSGLYINTSGTNAMSKGGSGDVLAGLIAGLLAQGANADHAAYLGVYLHGKAGEKAALRTGNYSMSPTDLLEGIGEVLREVTR